MNKLVIIRLIQFPSPAEAYGLARRYRRSAYDSLYLAAAEQLGVEFWFVNLWNAGFY